MSQLLIQDLYQVNPNSTLDNQVTTTNPFLISNLMNLDISIITLNISVFVLIWNFYISFLHISDFFYYYKIESDDNFAIEQKAISRLYLAMRIWLTTFPSILLITIALYSPINKLAFFSLSVLFYFFKIIYDLRLFAQITSYFSWYSNIFINLKKLRLK